MWRGGGAMAEVERELAFLPVSVDRTEEEGGGVGFGLAEMGQGERENGPGSIFLSPLQFFISFKHSFMFLYFKTK